MKQRLLRLLDPVLRGPLGAVAVKLWVSSASRLSPADGLRRLLELDRELQERMDVLATDLDDGIHAKHRLTGYHEFFVARIEAGQSVLDVGCGKGELANDLALRSGARVTGLDFNASSIELARARYHAPGLEFVEGDALEWQPPYDYDVVVLSNVLEHIAPRVELLRRLAAATNAPRFLIRVPSIERDWLVALRQDLGLDHFGDPTHEIEYTEASLRAELSAAGFRVEELEQHWGELWVQAAQGL
jgi:SAM-dependent methyltransferase